MAGRRHIGRRPTAGAGFFNAQRRARSLRGVRDWMVVKANWVVRVAWVQGCRPVSVKLICSRWRLGDPSAFTSVLCASAHIDEAFDGRADRCSFEAFATKTIAASGSVC
jgi:hypothetical protein